MESQHVSTPSPRLTSFVGGDAGEWEVTSQSVLVGPDIPAVARMSMVSGGAPVPAGGTSRSTSCSWSCGPPANGRSWTAKSTSG